MKVFDNLYFFGQSEYSVWAITTSEGIIVLDTIFDYSVEDEVVDGMKKLGLDPRKVKYVILSHAHGDHDGGAKLLQDEIPEVRVVYGAEDWESVDNSTNRPGGKPKHDMVADDGMRVSVGDASIRIVTMPGHTPGTLSYLFEVRDNGKPLRVVGVMPRGFALPGSGNAASFRSRTDSMATRGSRTKRRVN